MLSACGLNISVNPKVGSSASITFGFTSFVISNSNPTNSTTFNLTYGTLIGSYSSYCLQENDSDENNCSWIVGSVPSTFVVSATENAKVLSLWIKNDLETSARMSSNSVTLDTTVLAPTGMTVIAPLTNPGTLTTPTLRVTGVEAGSHVQVYQHSSCNVGSLLGSAIATTAADVTSLALASGPHSLYATQTDLAGNVSACSALLNTYTVGTPGVLALNSTNDFGGVLKGLTKELEFELINSGEVDVTGITVSSAPSGVLSFTSGSYPGTAIAQKCGVTLAGGNATCKIKLTFTPSAIGEITSSFDLDYFDGSTTQTLTIDLTGHGGKIDISLKDWNFGSVRTNGSSYTIFKLRNPESVTLPINPILSGSSNFKFPGGYPGSGGPGNSSGASACGATLAAGASCEMIVAYNPSSAAGAQSGLITIGDDEITLSATGITPPTCSCLNAPGSFGGGDGSVGDPFQICNKFDLVKIHTDFVAQNNWVNKNFVQCADIDLGGSSSPWTPIGSGINAFKGSYDGNFYSIENLYHQSATDKIGLFYGIESGVIKNMFLKNVDILGGDQVGGISGQSTLSTITHSFVSGSVVGTNDVGGVSGSAQYGEFNHSFFLGSIQASSSSGGITGSASYTSFSHVFSLGSLTSQNDSYGGISGNVSQMNSQYLFSSMIISGTESGGGIFGSASYAQILFAHSQGSINSSTDYIGGIVGAASNIHLAHSQSSLTINSSGSSVGGLVGKGSEIDLRSSFATGTILCDSGCGGLVGSTNNSYVNQSYATGSVTGSGINVGGLIGQFTLGTLSDSYSLGRVVGDQSVGGLIGYVGIADIYRSYSASYEVGGTTLVSAGPFLGNDGSLAVFLNNFFWASGSINGVTPVLPTDPLINHITSRTATQLQTQSSYSTWDFTSVWNMNTAGNNLPYLLLNGPGIFSFDLLSGISGTTVIVKGTHFLGATFVGLDGQTTSSFTVDSDTQITVQLTGTVGVSKIKIVTPYGEAISGRTFEVLPVNPVVTSFSVASATMDDTITLTGTGFSLVYRININGTEITQFTVNSDTSITLTIPVGASTGTFELITSDGGAGSSVSYPITYPPLYISLQNRFDFKDSPIGRTRYQLVRLKNLSSSSLTINGVIKTGLYYQFAGGSYPGTSAGPGFTPEAGINPCGATLAAGASCEIMMTYTPVVVSGVEDIDMLKIVTPLGTAGAVLTGTPIAARSACDCAGVGNFGGGDGSVGDPYQICSRTHLENIHTNIAGQSGWNGIDFIQCNDINLNGSLAPFTPIGLDQGGSEVVPFEGNYDGNHYLIGNLYYHNSLKDEVGLFSHVYGATIKNVILYNLDLLGNFYTGGVAGFAENATLENNQSGGIIVGQKITGGIAGRITNSTVSHSFSHASVTSTQLDGGIVGYARDSTIKSSFSTRSHSGYIRRGGIVGQLNDSSIQGSYSLGHITGTSGVGGVVGNAVNSTIDSSYSMGNIIGTSTVGGFVGDLDNSLVYECYASGDVSASASAAGGFVGGFTSSTLENVYATGAVVATTDSAGGLIGLSNNGIVLTSYVANPSVTVVSGSGYAGYLTGDADPNILVGNHNYYWTDTSLQTGIIQAVIINSIISPLTTPQMQDPDSFNPFNFSNVWTMGQTGNNFPVLRSLK
jgi:hypothetical protein